MLGRRRIAATALFISALALLPASPAAAVQMGSELGFPADTGACALIGAGERACTLSQTTLVAGEAAPGGLVARKGGTISRWRLRTGTPTPGTAEVAVRLRVLDENEGGARTPYFDLPLGSPGVYGFSPRTS